MAVLESQYEKVESTKAEAQALQENNIADAEKRQLLR